MAGATELFGRDGEMAGRYRSIDWAATPLGPVESWPLALSTIIRTILDAPFPIAVWCGAQLLGVYNDAYSQILGDRHPAALMRPCSEVWSDIWPDVAAMFEQVREGGPAIYEKDAPFVLHRGGEPGNETVAPNAWFTFSLSGVRDERGEIIAFLNIASDSTPRMRAEQGQAAALAEAERAQTRMRDIFALAPAFMAVVRGPRHVFEYVNEAFYKLVGTRELIGRPVSEALPEGRDQGFEEGLTRVLESNEPVVARESPVTLFRLPGEHPEQRYIDIICYPITEADGTRSGVLAHGYDVTNHVLLRQEAQRARTDAEHANRAKSQFVANMSHEIRTPINAIVGYTDLMDAGVAGPLSEQLQHYVDRIRASSQHLLALVNDVLDLSKVEAGEMRLELRDSSLDEVADQAFQMMAPQAEAKGIEVRRDWKCSGLHFTGDADRTRQIVLNLLSNAVKFTETGGVVTVRCHTADEGDDSPEAGDWVIIEVEDTGRGIPAKDFGPIFEPFVQTGNKSDTIRDAGTGLGLTISRKMAHLMGGDLTVRSTVGVGSCFTLRLQQCTPEQPAIPADEWPQIGELAAPGTPSSLSRFGQALVEHSEPLENELIERLRSDPEMPDEADRSQLADHVATYFATIGKMLINLDHEPGDPARKDSEDILRVVSDRHGKQRRRLGWSRPQVEREYQITRDLLGSFFRDEAVAGDGADAESSLTVAQRLLDLGESGSLSGFERAEPEMSKTE